MQSTVNTAEQNFKSFEKRSFWPPATDGMAIIENIHKTNGMKKRASQKVLVTGGGGFLGGAIVKLVVERGDHVRSFSRSYYPELKPVYGELILIITKPTLQELKILLKPVKKIMFQNSSIQARQALYLMEQICKV